jgi:hypothetical protein
MWRYMEAMHWNKTVRTSIVFIEVAYAYFYTMQRNTIHCFKKKAADSKTKMFNTDGT